MNDPQRPFLLDGVWHAYALVNADHPTGNGSSWRHYTSTDMVTWHDEGIAIDKYDTPLGDAETGSVVVDTGNTSGLGGGTVIAILTQQSEGVQRQSLYYSTDGGYRFRPYAGNPVMENPGGPDFRDPKVVWDGEHGRWSMALAEGRRIGFYTSPDLIHWTYRSDFARDDLGTMETPDVFPSRARTIPAASAGSSGSARTAPPRAAARATRTGSATSTASASRPTTTPRAGSTRAPTSTRGSPGRIRPTAPRPPAATRWAGRAVGPTRGGCRCGTAARAAASRSCASCGSCPTAPAGPCARLPSMR
ncbi:Levanbiose-producing levanase [Clavibacter michiganensis subsp. michiganensis]|uniref:Levanbiose-producing levanase n=1 Tax=Clavibacter michiganensis subsp. michiganensis TaxID=33013 RepID=A0A251XEY3_CLAMM|nr:Levanbiose-producing levanase [Clavibacter michiganensis subsp. michiganensis]OUE00980.1 Levanbiose-producing levanase [Clavibacter michiganensis subsp. michiganensis]